MAGDGWLALPERICVAFTPLWSHTCTEIYRIRNNYNNTAFDTKQNNQIIYGEKKTAFLHYIATLFSLFLLCFGAAWICVVRSLIPDSPELWDVSLQFLMKKVKTGHTNALALTLDDFTFGQIFGIQK